MNTTTKQQRTKNKEINTEIETSIDKDVVHGRPKKVC